MAGLVYGGGNPFTNLTPLGIRVPVSLRIAKHAEIEFGAWLGDYRLAISAGASVRLFARSPGPAVSLGLHAGFTKILHRECVYVHEGWEVERCDMHPFLEPRLTVGWDFGEVQPFLAYSLLVWRESKTRRTDMDFLAATGEKKIRLISALFVGLAW